MQWNEIVIELVIGIVCGVILPLLVNLFIERRIQQKDAIKAKLKSISEFFERMEMDQWNVAIVELEKMLVDAEKTFEKDKELKRLFRPVKSGMISTLKFKCSNGRVAYDFINQDYLDFKEELDNKARGGLPLDSTTSS